MSLSVDKIKKISETEQEVFVFDTIDSTNAEAKRRAEQYKNAVFIANSQTDGRGRLGRNFYSPRDRGLYITFLKEAFCKSEDAVLITTAVSVAVCRAIRKTAGIDVGIKWVNDLYYNEKKVCGILAESVRDYKSGELSRIIIGIGINCDGAEFPDEIKEIAGSLGGVDRSRLAAELIRETDKIGNMIENRDFMDEYRKKSIVIGKEIVVVNTGEIADALDIDDVGGLVIKKRDGKTKTLSSGEISIRICGNNKV